MVKDFNYYRAQTSEIGIIEQIQPPLVMVDGLPNARLNELVIFEDGQLGQIFLLFENKAQILVFSKTPLRVGTQLTRTDQFVTIPASQKLLGKIIDPLGNSLSLEQSQIVPDDESNNTSYIPLDNNPLQMTSRTRINRPFYTGTILSDIMIPLGKGQKELIIGDRKTGKTSFILSAIRNQVKEGTIIIYAAIAKEKKSIKNIWSELKQQQLIDRIILVATDSDSPPSLITITPYAALSLAEYFRDQGQDVFIVLDDLTTHAKFYREISLVAKRFPGRDSYPGDIFYVHAKLLERAGNFKLNSKEVSITVMPVAETIEADITGYIATNLMSITDGHIFFDNNLFTHGRRPAINIALSVTRVGRQVQLAILRQINHTIATFLSEYEKIQNLSHFGAELNQKSQEILEKGEAIFKFFEQRPQDDIPLNVQVIFFALIWNNFFNNQPANIPTYRQNLSHAYQLDPQIRQIVDSLVATADDMQILVSKVNQHKDQLISMVTKEHK